MKRMILGTMMCVLMATVAMAQEQDSIVRRDMRPKHEMRADMRGEQFRGEHYRGERKGEFRKGEFDKKREDLTPEQRAKNKADFLTDKLTLTSKQNEKLQKVFLKEVEAFQKAKAELEGKDEAAKKEQFMALKANTDKQVKKILTDEEYAKYKQMGECRKGDHKGGKGKPHGKHHGGQQQGNHGQQGNAKSNTTMTM